MSETVLITGASSDIGVCLTGRIADKYDCILAHYARHDEGLLALKEKLGDRLVLLRADFSDEADVLSMINTIRERGAAPCHIVHLPAEQFDTQRFTRIDWATFQRGLDVSLRSAVLLAQAFLPAMKKAGRGKLVIMLSEAVGSVTPKHCAQYVCQKYALLGLMRALAAEYGDAGICVNGVSPSIVETKFISNQPEYLREYIISRSPVGRPLTTEEVSAGIEHLLSSAGDSINGQNITIDGGVRL